MNHFVWILLSAMGPIGGDDSVPQVVEVDGQPLSANVERVIDALDFFGAPMERAVRDRLRPALDGRDPAAIQKAIDQLAALVVTINPESRVKVQAGPAGITLWQGGYTPVVVKVVNQSTITKRLRATSPQAGPVYAGVAPLSMQRQDQKHLTEGADERLGAGRFLDLEVYGAPPMTGTLSGLAVEYVIVLMHSSEAGRREATIAFDVEQGNQDLGFRGQVPVLLDVRPAIPVRLGIRDHDGSPTTARFVFQNAAGLVYPPQPKRLAPDLFFQRQIYRHDGETVLLPPGTLTMTVGRGPEYTNEERRVEIADRGPARIDVKLERWVHPAAHGYFSGDHHIHGAGCAHYASPTQGVTPADMFRQVKGEALNVGCVLTWGPCFEFQRQFFSPDIDRISEPFHILKYDLEISGFGSQALGHVCLLNLRDQTYPGSDGTKEKGWPTWTTPVLAWARQQGAVTGYAHSASGLEIDPAAASRRLLERYDADRDGRLVAAEAGEALLPESFGATDRDGDGMLTDQELRESHERAADTLPNYAIAEMNGVGAMEICVSAVEGVCDFISAMDTPRIAEWNCWYHLLNCGMPIKVSGETDFPCMSGTRVGQGRVYVHLPDAKSLDFDAWCRGLADGRSYVSDGFAHALAFSVDDVGAGGTVARDRPATVEVRATVALAEELPVSAAFGNTKPALPRRVVGDTVNLYGHRGDQVGRGGMRRIEVVVNGQAVASADVPADGREHSLAFQVSIDESSWVALRSFPQMHTNPVNVLVAGQPIRTSRRSALWCRDTIRQLWQSRSGRISEDERSAAREAFDRAIAHYERVARQATGE